MATKTFQVEFDVIKGTKQLRREGCALLLNPFCWPCFPFVFAGMSQARAEMERLQCRIDDAQVRIRTTQGIDIAVPLDQIHQVSMETTCCAGAQDLYISTSVRIQKDVTQRIRLVAVRNPNKVQDIIMERRAALLQGRRLMPAAGGASNPAINTGVSYGYPLETAKLVP